MNHLPSTEAAIIPTAATGETLRAKPVVVIPSILVHVTLPVVLRRRVAPIAIQHDIDAIELEARLLPDHSDSESPADAGGEHPLGVGDVSCAREAPGVLCLGRGHLINQPLEIRAYAERPKHQTSHAAKRGQFTTERAVKSSSSPAAVLAIASIQFGFIVVVNLGLALAHLLAGTALEPSKSTIKFLKSSEQSNTATSHL